MGPPSIHQTGRAGSSSQKAARIASRFSAKSPPRPSRRSPASARIRPAWRCERRADRRWRRSLSPRPRSRSIGCSARLGKTRATLDPGLTSSAIPRSASRAPSRDRSRLRARRGRCVDAQILERLAHLLRPAPFAGMGGQPKPGLTRQVEAPGEVALPPACLVAGHAEAHEPVDRPSRRRRAPRAPPVGAEMADAGDDAAQGDPDAARPPRPPRGSRQVFAPGHTSPPPAEIGAQERSRNRPRRARRCAPARRRRAGQNPPAISGPMSPPRRPTGNARNRGRRKSRPAVEDGREIACPFPRPARG